MQIEPELERSEFSNKAYNLQESALSHALRRVWLRALVRLLRLVRGLNAYRTRLHRAKMYVPLVLFCAVSSGFVQ